MALETIALVAGIASAAVGVGTGVFSVIEQGKARKETKRARALEAARMEAQERRRRRQEIRQKRIAAASVLNFAAQTGTSSSSGPQGGLTSLSAQLGSNQGFANEIAGYNRGITAANQRASDFIGRANMISGFGSIAQNFLGSFGSFNFSSPSSSTRTMGTQFAASP